MLTSQAERNKRAMQISRLSNFSCILVVTARDACARIGQGGQDLSNGHQRYDFDVIPRDCENFFESLGEETDIES